MTAHSDKAECPSATMNVGKPPLPLTILPFSPGPFSNQEGKVLDLAGEPVAVVHKEDSAVRQADAQLLAASWYLWRYASMCWPISAFTLPTETWRLSWSNWTCGIAMWGMARWTEM